MLFFQQIYKYKKAFTLAEVLITLLMIGIVASLVIPALINDTQNQEFAVLLKKDVATLSSAAKMMIIDNAGTLAGVFSSGNDMVNKFGNYVIFTKKCSAGEQGCFYAGTNTWKTLYGDYGWFDHVSYGGTHISTAILSNGESIRFSFEDTNCEKSYGTEPSPTKHTCGWIHIDVNGFKGPNVLGRDLFALWITKTGIYPFGIQNDTYRCNKNDSSIDSGRGCAAVVLAGKTVE